MICRLLETGQHEDRVLHLLNTESSDTEHLAFIGHDISEQHDMSRINRHSVRRHGMLNLVVDGLSSGFDTEHLASLHDVIRSGLYAVDTWQYQRLLPLDRIRIARQHTICAHDLSQTVTSDEQPVDAAVLFVFRDDTSVDLRKTLDLNIGNRSLQVLQPLISPVCFVQVLKRGFVDVDPDSSGLLVGSDRLTCQLSLPTSGKDGWLAYAFLNLELGTDETPLDAVERNLELQFSDRTHVDVYLDPGSLLVPRFFNDGCNLWLFSFHVSMITCKTAYIAKNRLLNSTFDNPSRMFARRVDELGSDDRR